MGGDGLCWGGQTIAFGTIPPPPPAIKAEYGVKELEPGPKGM
jgi:hypothetical protein